MDYSNKAEYAIEADDPLDDDEFAQIDAWAVINAYFTEKGLVRQQVCCVSVGCGADVPRTRGGAGTAARQGAVFCLRCAPREGSVFVVLAYAAPHDSRGVR